MKKYLVILLAGVMMITAAACGGRNSSKTGEKTKEEAAETASEGAEGDQEKTDAAAEDEETANIPEAAMTHAQYLAAGEDTEVVIEGYIQGIQKLDDSQEDKTVTNIYLQDENGGYFIYQMPCTPKEYALLEVGGKIKVKGKKTDWHGETEVIDAVWQFGEGEMIAAPEDVTELLGTDNLISKQNMFVCFKGMTVESAGKNMSGKDVAFLYNWDGTGSDGDDLYFNVSVNGNTYLFTVESDLKDADSDVYRAVKNLKIGDVVDLEGFLYWYEEPNPHITKVTVHR